MTENVQISQPNDCASNKSRDLILSIILDLFGYATYAIPVLGEFADIVWAPIAGYLMTRIYKGYAGKVGGIFAFIEEAIPLTDFIPSFSIMWFYTYVIKKGK
jgi:hypothetical protein